MAANTQINQLSGVKENSLDRFAKRFQAAGIAAVVFDHRNWGASDGTPRHHTNQYEQTQDTHDVISYVSTLPEIDRDRIALWGSSFSGGVAIIAGACDPRIRVVVCQVPFVSGKATAERVGQEFVSRLYADRSTTTTDDPTYIPVYPETLEEARAHPKDFMLGTEESYHHYASTKHQAPDKENKITLQTMFHALRAEPCAFISQISPKPLFMCIGIKDPLVDAELQEKTFAMAGEPKQLLKLECGHFDVYEGEWFEKNVSAQIHFLQQYLV